MQVPPVVLEWIDLNCHWTSKKKQKKGKAKAADGSSSSGSGGGGSSSGTKQILHNLSGQAAPGR